MAMTEEQKKYMIMFGEHLLDPILTMLVNSMEGQNPFGARFPGFEAPDQLPSEFKGSILSGKSAELPSGRAILFQLKFHMAIMSPEELSDYMATVQEQGAQIVFMGETQG